MKPSFDSLFRQLTPLVLLGVAALALLHPWLPGADWAAQHLGANFVLGFCVFLLGLYVLLLWGESLRLHAMMGAVLRELMEFKGRRDKELQGRPAAHKLDAARMLLEALGSQDPKVAAMAQKNLQSLTDKDFGVDVDRWRAWLDEAAKG